MLSEKWMNLRAIGRKFAIFQLRREISVGRGSSIYGAAEQENWNQYSESVARVCMQNSQLIVIACKIGHENVWQLDVICR